ncbi:complex I intermediate-associated protein [Xylariomycetidae sp. FL0641]|nr:complex I intermediate-associated protein [Xylariomycetidae sp. FL0641]
MRSQVARYVLRQLPARRASVVGPVLARPVFRTYPVGCRVARTPQRRAFLNLFRTGSGPRILKEIESEPGYEILLTHRVALQDKSRPPPTAELLQAWRNFFGFKLRHGRAVNHTQAVCALGVLKALSEPETPDNDRLSIVDMRTAMTCLLRPPRDDASMHLELAKTLYREIRRSILGIIPNRFQNVTLDVRIKNTEAPDYAKDLNSLLAALSQYGAAIEARDMLVEYYKTAKDKAPLQFSTKQIWMPIIDGLAKEGREEELRDLIVLVQEAGVEFDPEIHGVMTTFYAQRDNVTETIAWFEQPIARNLPPSPETFYQVLHFALRNKQKAWATNVYENLISSLESGPLKGHKPSWDVSFQWAVLLLGKGVDHVERMIKVALENPEDIPSPNIGTINSLLKVACDKNDPYLAERLVSLSKKIGFQPNLQTFILQLEYRIQADDLDGAFETFQAMRGLDSPSRKAIEVTMLNALIRALCDESKPNYERVLEVTSHLESQHVTLEPETVVSICMAFLKNDEKYEVIDTLSLHTVHYSVAERAMVRKAFVDYCLNRHNSTARVWDAYALLRQFFPEVESEHRLAIMDAFFDRKRADMAAQVFGHMRAHRSPSIRPTQETYIRFFEGVGRAPDMQSLKMVHNMLKMDTMVQLNTQLYNALMIGFIACETPHRALDFWREITITPEGPTYATLELVFRAYEITPYGDGLAKELWEKINRMNIDVPLELYAAYVTTLAAHSHLAEVKTLLDDMDNVVGKRPNLHTLAYVYNALPTPEMQEDFEAWAKHEYPPTWEALQRKYRKIRRDEVSMKFKIPRPMKA